MPGRFLPVNEVSGGRYIDRFAVVSNIDAARRGVRCKRGGGSALTKSIRPSSLGTLAICACAPDANSRAAQNRNTMIAKWAGLWLRLPITFRGRRLSLVHYCKRATWLFD